jgi:hypothetical protein
MQLHAGTRARKLIGRDIFAGRTRGRGRLALDCVCGRVEFPMGTLRCRPLGVLKDRYYSNNCRVVWF